MTWTSLRINGTRFQQNFNQLARIGATNEGGVHRPALGETHLKARAWFREKALQAGLGFQEDSAGNHSAILTSNNPDARTLLIGSHLDSVPNGGRFDGALGVLAALETAQTIQDSGLFLPVNLEVIDFTDEEGTLVGLLGSMALAGKLKAEDLVNPRGGRENLLAGLEKTGLTEAGLLSARRPASSLAGYLEVHIEQGKRLLTGNTQIGIVTTIVGICSYRLVFIGRADHAGTTSMEGRLDAAQGAADFTLSARMLVMQEFPDCVANVGDMRFEPGAYNIVPEKVAVSLEFRSPDAERYQQLEERLLDLARQAALKFGLGLEIELRGKHQPSPMSAKAQTAIDAACQTLGLSSMPLASGAGHDAQAFDGLCPAGMIFVPSVEGASHSSREFTEWRDCINGANILLHSVLNFLYN